MSDQQGFPEPFGDGGAGPDGPSGPDNPRGMRGRTIAIIVLSVLVAILIIVVATLVFAKGTKVDPTASPIVTPTTPSPTHSGGTPTPTQTSGATATCSVSDLSVTLGSMSGAAGSTYVPILFKNSSSKACELHGFPGVSFVGKGNGTQLGAPADWDQSKPIVQNTLQPGSTVAANVRIAQAGNYDPGECQPLAADGFRVYPPHSTQSVFVQTQNLTACQNAQVHLLTVIAPVAPQ
ncbi:DUF4232 domain-containing protein [Rathayibacter sp. KR2-224]|uniref:DUF4232 domain-containing protein n=1 Tax=Rathayibacter sp. KR2-224 TaxID=3400913 RepID=UPI003C01CFCB